MTPGVAPPPSADAIDRLLLRGGTQAILARGGIAVIRLGSLLILARLLTPEAFGIVAMVSALLAIAAVFRDTGIASSLVQHPELSHRQVNSLFWLNLAAGGLLAGLVFAVTPHLDVLYGSADASAVGATLAPTLLLGAVSGHQLALLRRRMRFGALTLVGLGSALAGAGTGISLAWGGGGVWALVAATLVTEVTSAILAFRFEPWRPTRPEFDRSAKPLLAFGGYVTGFSFLGAVASNLPTILLGRFWGTAAVGLYGRAQWLLSIPIQYVVEPMSSAAVPALAPLQSDVARYRSTYLAIASALALFTFPAGLFCITHTEKLIAVLLGPQWAEASGILRLLAVSLILQPVCMSSGWIYLSQGRGRAMMAWGIFGWAVLIIASAIGAYGGPLGLAAAHSISFALLFWPCMALSFRGTTITMRDLAQACTPPLAASVAAAAASAAACVPLAHAPTWAQLGTAMLAFALAYVLVLLAFADQRRLLVAWLDSMRRRGATGA